jgi:uncharacterized protein YdbL (DUF1318 family)
MGKWFMSKQNSLILEIQQIAMDNSIKVTDLLRKALLVSKKLGLQDFQEWVGYELYGYAEEKVPSYRKVRAEISVRNPYHGLIPLSFQDSELANTLLNISLVQPIESIVDLIKNIKPNSIGPIVSLSPEQEKFLLEAQGEFRLPPIRTISINQLTTLVDIVRTKILEWALDLESQGILGEGLTFSNTEKIIASSTTSINIENFQGILGNVENSAVTQNLDLSINKGDFEGLQKELKKLGVEQNDINELKTAIENEPEIKKQGNFGEMVGTWIGKMMQKAAIGSWDIGVTVAGNILATLIAKYYGF